LNTVKVFKSDGLFICTASVADRFVSRGVGLLGRKALGLQEGLLIKPCSSVHTLFMRFAIDVLYLDDEGSVLRAVSMPSFRFSSGGPGATTVLELPAYAITTYRIAVGTRLIISE
jgi:uncharacterized protein